ncbi:MAG: FAD-dependent oxidoreductase [Clostridia bacterium]|nr:FAD-dependent oxidoreductase [Clostridia bacterium]
MKTTYTKEIRVRGEYDVVICGGGPAGIGAAVAAAEKGAKTLLVERLGFLGGMATAGLVNPMSEFAYNNKRVIGGIAWRFAKMLEDANGAIIEYPRCNISFNPEIYKVVAQRMVLGAGVDLLTNTQLVDCVVLDGCIKEIIVAGKNGMEAIRSKYFIDATGDATLAEFAGMEMLENSRPMQPGTLCFTMANVDTSSERLNIIHQKTQGINHQAMCIREKLLELKAQGVCVPQFGGPWLCTTLNEGVITLNLTRAAMDASNAESYNAAERTLLEDVFTFAKLITENVEEFKNAYVSSVATITGTRQSRRIKGIHTLTGEEYANGVKFKDSIARACHAIDIHLPGDEGQILKYPDDAGYIPYDSMVNENFDNLIIAGRAISADEDAFAAIRVQAPCMEMGQAAGFAVNICMKNGNIPVWNINRAELVEKVRKEGSFV